MTEISDSLRLLFGSPVEERGGEYVVSIPEELVENGSVSAGETYRVALLAAASADDSGTEPEEDTPEGHERSQEPDPSGRRAKRPPVEEGEVRSVTIDTLGDQGDGIAKVERGFIVIVSDTQPGDQVDVKITDVKDTVAFAEPVGEATVR
jgi:predicted RNA-binding protein with TRAM domain